MTATTEKPLVTFAVFSYNQERYIRETVLSAFSQTYERLEIILSDDGSADRTFEIIQHLTDSYSGPHNIKLVKRRPNLGIVNHVMQVAREARGALLIVNAGDDLSYPGRTSEIVKAWLETGAIAFSSNFDEISSDGIELRRDCPWPPVKEVQSIFRRSGKALRFQGDIRSVPGFCAAYQRDFWTNLPFPSQKLFMEDGIATLLLNTRGNVIHHVPKSLMARRIHSAGYSDFARYHGTESSRLIEREQKINVVAREIVIRTRYVIGHAFDAPSEIDAGTLEGLETHIRYGEIVHGFWQDSWRGRWFRLLRSRASADFLYVIPRLAGFHNYVRLVKLYRALGRK